MKKLVACLGIITLSMVSVRGDVVPAAQKVAPQGEPPTYEDDYFELYHGNPCDFEKDGDFERIAGFGDGITGAQVKNGALSFTTGEKDNYFFMGRWFYPKGDTSIPDENAGFGCRDYDPVQLKVRLKQSLPSSTWTIGVRSPRGMDGNVPGRTTMTARNKEVSGTEWQEVTFSFYSRTLRPARAVYFETTEPNNKIEIDSIRIVLLRTPVYYRKTVTLPSEPVYAKLRVNLVTEHSTYINGERVHYFHGFSAPERVPVVDITPYLHKGDNTIAVGCTNTFLSGRKYRLRCEGLALTKDGKFVSLSSDRAWRGSFAASEGWYTPAFDETAWQPVQQVEKTDTEVNMLGGQAHYIGPLVLSEGDEPIFFLEQGIDVSLVLPKGYTVSYTLVDSFTEKMEKEGVFQKRADGALERHRLTYKTDRVGVWNLAMDLKDGEGNVVAQRRMEIPVVGRFEQKVVKGESFTEGMDLRKIVDIDCTADPSSLQQKFYYVGKDVDSTVTDAAVGKYRESEGNTWSGFAYAFSVENLYKPHVVEVEYPDDVERVMMVKVFSGRKKEYVESPEKARWDWAMNQRWYDGVATGGDRFPESQSFKKLYLIFWPDGLKGGNTVQLITEKAGLKAAARSIRVYELENDLPALDVPNTPNRLFGQFVEREPILVKTMYTGRYNDRFAMYEVCYDDTFGRIRDWYITTENLIKYMRFCGHNLYIPGYCMYSGIYFPEERGQSRGGGRRRETDHFRLMAAMFKANDLNLILGAQYEVTIPAIEKKFPTNWEVLHEGKESAFGVCVDGRQALRSGSAGTGTMDFSKPSVDEDIRAMLSKYLEYGKEYESVRGVLLYTASMGFPSMPMIALGGVSDSALAWGLTDEHVAEFPDKTGIRLPGQKGEPGRMLARYEYLAAHEDIRDRWVNFRCEKLHNQVSDLLKTVREVRPDWRFYVTPAGPAPAERQLVEEGKLSYQEALRIRGYDLGLYREEGIANNLSLLCDHLRETGELKREINGYPKDTFCYEDRRPTAAHTQAVVPTEPYGAHDLVLNLVNYTPSEVVFGKADVRIVTGGEQRLRPFAKAFRSIPAAEYKTLTENGLDLNMVVRAGEKEGQPVFYIVNPHKYPFKVTLQFAKNAKVVDLAEGNTVCDGQDRMTCALAPFDLKVYSSSERLTGADSELPKDVAKRVKERAALFEYCQGLGAEQIDFLMSQWFVNSDADRILQQINALQKFQAAGDVLRTIDIYGRPALNKFLFHAEQYRTREKAPEARDNYRVICGSNDPYTDTQGNLWLADQRYVYGVDAFGFVGGDFAAKRGSVEIENTADPEIYRSERFRVQGYRFVVPDGTYTVKLHFAETFKPIKEMRLFDVDVEGKTCLDDFDIFADGGFQSAVVKTLKDVAVKDGELTIDFSWSTVNPVEINGIEVLKQ